MAICSIGKDAEGSGLLLGPLSLVRITEELLE
jgi:hypothetical protein